MFLQRVFGSDPNEQHLQHHDNTEDSATVHGADGGKSTQVQVKERPFLNIPWFTSYYNCHFKAKRGWFKTIFKKIMDNNPPLYCAKNKDGTLPPIVRGKKISRRNRVYFDCEYRTEFDCNTVDPCGEFSSSGQSKGSSGKSPSLPTTASKESNSAHDASAHQSSSSSSPRLLAAPLAPSPTAPSQTAPSPTAPEPTHVRYERAPVQWRLEDRFAMASSGF